MNWESIRGNWRQIKVNVKEKWGKLTDEDLTVINDKRDQLAGLLQTRYGYAKEGSEAQRDALTSSLKMI